VCFDREALPAAAAAQIEEAPRRGDASVAHSRAAHAMLFVCCFLHKEIEVV
jgi:hypothetical protein